MANSTTTTEAQNVSSKLLTLDDTVKAFTEQMDSSMVPPISDGMSYTDESYDITWNIDNILLYGRTLNYLHSQRDNKQNYLNSLENTLDQMEERESLYGDEKIAEQRSKCGQAQEVVKNMKRLIELYVQLFNKFVGDFIGLDGHSESDVAKLVDDVSKYLEMKKRNNMKTNSKYSTDI
tara:strand:+ start:1754 stop:2287 length:534 start_codon:yes stop_codon:yes gene_type:complete